MAWMLMAAGYQGVVLSPLWEQLGLQPDANGLLPAENYRSIHERVFVAGDARRGQSLVVWALEEGKRAAEAIVKSEVRSEKMPYCLKYKQ